VFVVAQFDVEVDRKFRLLAGSRWLLAFCWWSVCLTSLSIGSFTRAESPKYGPQATRLFVDHRYLQQSAAADYWRLSPYYLGQRDDRSCSLACVTMLVNFARAKAKLRADQPLATQDELFERVDSKLWRAGLAAEGAGVTLDQLAELSARALIAYEVQGAKVHRHHMPVASPEELTKLRTLLAANEKSDDDLWLVNVLQSELTGDPEGAVGHFIPVAAYDAELDRVLLLDPDRRWYEPYWVSTATLLKAMSTIDADSGLARGYLIVEFAPQ
jgi:hypothetical protein